LLNITIFLDNTGFEKMCARAGTLFVFAGSGRLIECWKTWIKTLPAVFYAPPPFEIGGTSIAITVTDMEDARIRYEHDQTIIEKLARFAGSGAYYAYESWKRNSSPVGAVKSAIFMDRGSGGEVKFYRFNGDNNLSDTIDYQELERKFQQGGIAMNPERATQGTLLTELAKTDAEAKKALESLKNGSAEIIAPSPGMCVPWTDEDKRQLMAVMGEFCKKL
jgi:hypothetical protein